MLKMAFRFGYILLTVAVLVTAFVSSGASAGTSNIEILQVEGTIVPVVADYIERGISQAESKGSTACIIELDTPGGLLSSCLLYTSPSPRD